MEAPSTWWNPLDGKAALTGEEGAGQLHTPAATREGTELGAGLRAVCPEGWAWRAASLSSPTLLEAVGWQVGEGLVPATLPCLLSATKTLLPPRVDSPPLPSPILG